MCGIAGFAGEPPLSAALLSAMGSTLRHRGPDDGATWSSSDGLVGLAHRRLSVIDLSAAARQPMMGPRARTCLAFNGEIYNYRELRRQLVTSGYEFKTESDTEVILQAYEHWGEGWVERLNGMFALALYDHARRALYLARDRAGEKPLFIWRTPSRIVFASELKAILALPGAPRRIDAAALDAYLAWGYVPGTQCILAGVEKLSPGSILRLDLNAVTATRRRYWDLPELRPPARPQPVDEQVDRVAQLLEQAVARQLVADVPLGVLLSGGVDSSLVTALAARRSPDGLKTFTVTFPGHGALDEAHHARRVANHFGTEHTELPAPSVGDDLLPFLMRHYDEPIADSSMVPMYLVAKLFRDHATVALGGDGADELFGGYPSYQRLLLIERLRKRLPGVALRGIAATARRLDPGFRGRNLLLALDADSNAPLLRIGLFFAADWRQRLLRASAPDADAVDCRRVVLAAGASSLLDAAQRIDFRSYLCDDVLVKVDRASMAASLEVRAPFLDTSVIEFAFGSVPDSQKVTPSERKVLLRRLAARLLPRDFDIRRKQGFAIPLSPWLAGAWRPLVEDILRRPAIFDAAAVAALLAAESRSSRHGPRVFALLAFELWQREYGVHL